MLDTCLDVAWTLNGLEVFSVVGVFTFRISDNFVYPASPMTIIIGRELDHFVYLTLSNGYEPTADAFHILFHDVFLCVTQSLIPQGHPTILNLLAM